MDYMYITKDNLENRLKYNYSEFGGADFLLAFSKSRSNAFEYISGKEDNKHITKTDLNLFLERIETKDANRTLNKIIDQYVKSYEVHKRIYSEYDRSFRPVDGTSYLDYENYILLAHCCAKLYENTKCMKYLSCMLKIDDTLISIINRLDQYELFYLREILEKEQFLIDQLIIKMGVEI